jgi:hypothetical protein
MDSSERMKHHSARCDMPLEDLVISGRDAPSTSSILDTFDTFCGVIISAWDTQLTLPQRRV